MLPESMFVANTRLMPKAIGVVPWVRRQARHNSVHFLLIRCVYKRSLDWITFGNEETDEVLDGEHGVLATLQTRSIGNRKALQSRHSLETLPNGSCQSAMRTDLYNRLNVLLYCAVRMLCGNHIAERITE